MDNLLGGALYICQSGEIIPDDPEACQNLKKMKGMIGMDEWLGVKSKMFRIYHTNDYGKL